MSPSVRFPAEVTINNVRRAYFVQTSRVSASGKQETRQISSRSAKGCDQTSRCRLHPELRNQMRNGTGLTYGSSFKTFKPPVLSPIEGFNRFALFKSFVRKQPFNVAPGAAQPSMFRQFPKRRNSSSYSLRHGKSRLLGQSPISSRVSVLLVVSTEWPIAKEIFPGEESSRGSLASLIPKRVPNVPAVKSIEYCGPFQAFQKFRVVPGLAVVRNVQDHLPRHPFTF